MWGIQLFHGQRVQVTTGLASNFIFVAIQAIFLEEIRCWIKIRDFCMILIGRSWPFE